MNIPSEKIIELIAAAQRMMEVLPPKEQYIHAADLAITLQAIIDAEVDAIDAWSDEMAQDEARAAAHDDESWGELEMAEAAVERELWYVEGI